MRKQKVWFITGASKGMGLEITKAVLNNGDKVVATTRDAETFSEEVSIDQENVFHLKLDITKENEVERAISTSIEKFGKIDVVVNNAGYNLLGNVEEIGDVEFKATMGVNVFGLASVIRHVLPHMRKQKLGHIINTSSMMGYTSYAANGSYSASKYAVIGLSEALAQEVAPFGISVTILAPGSFRTGFMNPDSLSVVKNKIDGYNLDKQVELFTSFDGKQLGDPKKLAEILLKITEMQNPPLHLPLGSDSYNAILAIRDKERKELEEWKHLSLYTDFT